MSPFAQRDRARSAVSVVFRAELRQLVRDRRALFAAVLLPALLYPLIFWGSKKLETVGRETMAEREVKVLVDVRRAVGGQEGETARRVLAALAERRPIRLVDVDASELLDLEARVSRDVEARVPRDDEAHRRRDDEASLRREEARREAGLRLLGAGGAEDPGHVLVTARPHPESDARTLLEIWYDVQDDTAREGVDRARAALSGLARELAAEARVERLGGDPGAGLAPRTVDTASEEDTRGAALGRWLPFLAMLVLISGGAYAALAIFAGEREAGTLETLLVQPVPHRSVAGAKFLAVLAAGIVTVVVNLASLVACTATGLAAMPGFEGGEGGVSLARLGLASLVLLPACALLSAILCVVCGKARTFREGQLLVMPVTFLVLVPTAIVLRPEAELGVLWAIVPFAGTGLAVREALEGDLVLALGALAAGSHLAWTWLALGRVASLLDGDRALREGRDAAHGSLRKRAASFGQLSAFAVVMTLYLVAQSLQRADLEGGLVATFWVILPLFAVGIARFAPRASDAGGARRRAWWRDFNAGAPAAAHLAGALLLVPFLALCAERWARLQMEWLPLPREAMRDAGLAEVFAGRETWWLLFFFALSPGLTEELAFRGSILSSMRRGMRAWRAIAFQGMWFALAHASIYRLAPTFVLGALLAALALRARSIWPGVALHAAYNGWMVLGANERLPAFAADARFASWWPWLAVPGVLLLALPPRGRAPVGAD